MKAPVTCRLYEIDSNMSNRETYIQYFVDASSELKPWNITAPHFGCDRFISPVETFHHKRYASEEKEQKYIEQCGTKQHSKFVRECL